MPPASKGSTPGASHNRAGRRGRGHGVTTARTGVSPGCARPACPGSGRCAHQGARMAIGQVAVATEAEAGARRAGRTRAGGGVHLDAVRRVVNRQVVVHRDAVPCPARRTEPGSRSRHRPDADPTSRVGHRVVARLVGRRGDHPSPGEPVGQHHSWGRHPWVRSADAGCPMAVASAPKCDVRRMGAARSRWIARRSPVAGR